MARPRRKRIDENTRKTSGVDRRRTTTKYFDVAETNTSCRVTTSELIMLMRHSMAVFLCSYLVACATPEAGRLNLKRAKEEVGVATSIIRLDCREYLGGFPRA